MAISATLKCIVYLVKTNQIFTLPHKLRCQEYHFWLMNAILFWNINKKIGFYKTQQCLRRYRVFSVWCKLCFFVNLIDLFKQVFHKTFKDVSISIISKITSEKHAFYFASLLCLSKSSSFYAKKDFPKMYSINVSAWANFWNSIYWR